MEEEEVLTCDSMGLQSMFVRGIELRSEFVNGFELQSHLMSDISLQSAFAIEELIR